MKKHINYLLLITLLIGNAPLAAIELPECTLKDMVGEQPQEVCTIIETLKEFQKQAEGNDQNENDEDSEQQELPFKNRFVLHGPPGTGKGTIARKIAEITNRKLIEYPASQILGRYQNQGAETIRSIFDEAERSTQSGERVVIFFDEIDILASSNNSEQNKEYAAAISELWIQLDKHKNNGDIFFVCTTNRFKSLSAPFRGRFGNNTIKVGKPNLQNRKLLLKHFFDKVKINLNKKQIDDFAHLSEGLDPRGIEDLAIGSRTLLNRIRKEHGDNGKISITQIRDMLKKIKENHADDKKSLEEMQKEQMEYDKKQRAANEDAKDGGLLLQLTQVIIGIGGLLIAG